MDKYMPPVLMSCLTASSLLSNLSQIHRLIFRHTFLYIFMNMWIYEKVKKYFWMCGQKIYLTNAYAASHLFQTSKFISMDFGIIWNWDGWIRYLIWWSVNKWTTLMLTLSFTASRRLIKAMDLRNCYQTFLRTVMLVGNTSLFAKKTMTPTYQTPI